MAQSNQDQWVENFKQSLRRNLANINKWHEAKLKHEDFRSTLQRKKVGERTYIFNDSTIVMVHEPDLH